MMRATNPNPTGNPMSNSTPQSNPNLAAQAAAQAAQAAIQSLKGKAQNADADDNAESSPAETDEQLAKAWGFSGRRPKLSREAVIGLFAIVALLGLFGYVVARHLKNRSTVAEKPDKVDHAVTPASAGDLFDKQQSVVNLELDELDKNAAKPKRRTFDDDFGIGDGQNDPDAANVVTKKPSMPTSRGDEFDDFDEDTKIFDLCFDSAGALSASFLTSLPTARIARNSTKAIMMKLSVMVRKLPQANTAPCFFASTSEAAVTFDESGR